MVVFLVAPVDTADDEAIGHASSLDVAAAAVAGRLLAARQGSSTFGGALLVIRHLVAGLRLGLMGGPRDAVAGSFKHRSSHTCRGGGAWVNRLGVMVIHFLQRLLLLNPRCGRRCSHRRESLDRFS